jgi:hypothetical protein
VVIREVSGPVTRSVMLLVSVAGRQHPWHGFEQHRQTEVVFQLQKQAGGGGPVARVQP